MSDQTPRDPKDPQAAVESAQQAARRAEAAAATAKKERDDALAIAETAREAARKAGRFSREFFVTVISVVSTAFGVVVALAWNSALQAALVEAFGIDGRTLALFVYALLITFLAVIAIVIMSRVARRIGAEPIEFKIDSNKE
jgi:Family of unknown function (DUF5654)